MMATTSKVATGCTLNEQLAFLLLLFVCPKLAKAREDWLTALAGLLACAPGWEGITSGRVDRSGRRNVCKVMPLKGKRKSPFRSNLLRSTLPSQWTGLWSCPRRGIAINATHWTHRHTSQAEHRHHSDDSMKCILSRVTVVASLFTEDHFFPSPFLHFPPLILRTVTVSIFIVCAYRCSIGNCHLVILVSVNVGNLGNLLRAIYFFKGGDIEWVAVPALHTQSPQRLHHYHFHPYYWPGKPNWLSFWSPLFIARNIYHHSFL